MSVKKDYLVLLIQLNGNLASDVSTRYSGCPQGNLCLSVIAPVANEFVLYLTEWLVCLEESKVHV